MSAFICHTCDSLSDADDGCEETADGFHLICADCADAAEAEREEADDRRRANPLEPDFRGMAQ